MRAEVGSHRRERDRHLLGDHVAFSLLYDHAIRVRGFLSDVPVAGPDGAHFERVVRLQTSALDQLGW
jgi:hypothetical protein